MKNLQSKLVKKLKKSFCILLTFIFAFSVFASSGITVQAASIKTPKISSVTAKSSSSIKIKWKKVSGATGYIIYQQKGSGEYKNIKVIKDNDVTSYTKKSLSSATKYSYKVRAYKSKSGKKTYSSKSVSKSTYTKPSTPEITSIKSPSKTTIKLKWEKISKASGYAIYRKSGDDYNKVATIKSNKTTSYTIKGLKSGKKYTYVVRSYIKRNGKNIYSSNSYSESIYTTHTHKYTKTVTKPTCDEEGYTTYKCFCGKKYKSNYTSPKHNFEDFECTECGEIDKSNSYEYLKQWVIDNGEINGAYIHIYDGNYGISYSSNADYIYLTCSYYNSYDDFGYYQLKLKDFSYFSAIGENLLDDYVSGTIDPKTFSKRSPLSYDKCNDTYYTYSSIVEATRSNICSMLDWLSEFLENEDLPITLYDLGFEAFE